MHTFEMASDVLKKKKDANNIIDLINMTKSGDEEQVRESIQTLHCVFSEHIRSRHMYRDKADMMEGDVRDADLSKEDQYKFWLGERYRDSFVALVALLHHSTQEIRELALCTVMKLISEECNQPVRKISKKTLSFPASNFEPVVIALMSHKEDCQKLIAKVQEYLQFDDVRHFSMKFILRDLIERSSLITTQTYNDNLFCFLENITMPEAPENDQLTRFLCNNTDPNLICKMNSFKEQKKLFTTLWLEFLKQKLTKRLYKKVLMILDDKVLPYLTSPMLLSDFLTESYNIGGVTSLLALNGLFTLIQTFNLEYPHFYKRLYALLDPEILHVRYRARFFFLTDLFLTSTHLPAYLVAAFAKRLSRLLLTSPPSGLKIIIPLIYNLINRHPNSRVLIHRTDGPRDISQDPFDMNELDPVNCKALESSLWELKTLQDHYYHAVGTEAKKIDHPLINDEINLSPILETSAMELFSLATKRKVTDDIATTFIPPKKLFANKEDQFMRLWTLD